MKRRTFLVTSILLIVAVWSTPDAALAVGPLTVRPDSSVILPAYCALPQLANPAPASFTPWLYRRDNGGLLLGEHEFYEDPASTVDSLSRELITLADQSGVYPEALLFNTALFDPPEGSTGGKPRRLLGGSLWMKSVQLYVNYSNKTVDPSINGKRYFSPTFFLSIDGHAQNSQPIQPVPWSGFSSLFISTSDAEFGCIFQSGLPHGEGACDDLYITGGFAYGLSELDSEAENQMYSALAQRDRLMNRDTTVANGRWQDISENSGCPNGNRIPTSAALGNSSGVVFADFTGDGFDDLYVGKSGDGYLGAQNVLLINDGTGCFDDRSSWVTGELAKATVDLATGDLDLDGDLDIAVANRCRRVGACGAEAADYVLINNLPLSRGFTVVPLSSGFFSDSRSVSVGDLTSKDSLPTYPEIVFGNAGNDGFANVLVFPAGQDHRMEIYYNEAETGGALNNFIENMPSFLNGLQEPANTRPLTVQIRLVDLFSPTTNLPDGWLDMVVVNHRDHLKHATPFAASSQVVILVNQGDQGWLNWPATGNHIQRWTAFGAPWIRTAVHDDFTGNGYLDILEGRGHRFGDAQSELRKNLGSGGPVKKPFDSSGGFIGNKSYESMPGNEHGYGFDFADLANDGYMDALQTSRGYDYLITDIFHPSQGTDHQDFAPGFFGQGAGLTSNKRGLLKPKGMEDGVFADFNEDGFLDAILASQRTPSTNHPSSPQTPDTIVLVNNGSSQFGYDEIASGGGEVEDGRIDLMGRTQHPNIADRVVAGDLDNDGDVDALVKLFQIQSGSVLKPADQACSVPLSQCSFGWRYLRNVAGEAGAGNLWFRDVAFTDLDDATGNYDPIWNQPLGMIRLLDADNNGALDFYSTVGFPKTAAEVNNIPELTDDRIFLNGVGAKPFGVLQDYSAAILPDRCLDVVTDGSNDPQHVSCGSFGLTQGDIDNDGDADVVVTHRAQTGRTNYPWLLVNRLNENGVRAFVDEWSQPRIPIGSFSNVIHTADRDSLGNPTVDMDRAMFPALLDWDGDGDLDMALLVEDDLPRMLRNVGKDSNKDGVINAADTPPPGSFVDVTDTLLTQIKPTTDSQDLIGVDIDGDGDFDLANDPFGDRMTVWRNDLQPSSYRPVVTEIWPRVGSIRGTTLELHGVNLKNVAQVEFRFANQSCLGTNPTTVAGSGATRLQVTIPVSCPVGLAQVRIQRSWQLQGCANVLTSWSQQYFGYFVLKPVGQNGGDG